MTPNITFNDVLRAAVVEQMKLPAGYPTIAPAPDTEAQKSARLKTFDAKKVAELIYDAKGTFYDDEDVAIEAIKLNIKNIKQYIQVNKELQKLTDGRGIGAYLRSFTNVNQRIQIVQYLSEILPETQWDWTIKNIITYADVKTALGNTNAQRLRTGGYNKFIVNLITNPKLYQSEFNSDKGRDEFMSADAQREMTNILYGGLDTFHELAAYVREKAYTPAGIVTTFVLDEIPYVNIGVKVAFGLLAIDDIVRLTENPADGWVWLDLIFDSMGVAAGAVSRILGKVLKGFFGLFRIGTKFTIAAAKFLIEAFLKLSSKSLELIGRILGANFKAAVLKLIKYIAGGFVKLLEKAGLTKLAKSVQEMATIAANGVAWAFEKYIIPFFQQVKKIIIAILEFPGKTVEYILEKLGYTYSKETGKVIKQGVKLYAGVKLIQVAFEHVAEWAGSTYWKYKMQQMVKRTEAEQKAYWCDYSKRLYYSIVATPKNETTNVYGIDANNKFVLIATYKSLKSPYTGNDLPFIVNYDKKQGEYVAVSIFKNADSDEKISMQKLNDGRNTYLFMKLSDMNLMNKKPLKSYDWAKGKNFNCK